MYLLGFGHRPAALIAVGRVFKGEHRQKSSVAAGATHAQPLIGQQAGAIYLHTRIYEDELP